MNQITTPTTATVDLVDGHPVTYSYAIAQHFGRAHKTVLHAVRDSDCSAEFRRQNFLPSSYLNAQGKAQPSVTMTRDRVIRLQSSLIRMRGQEVRRLGGVPSKPAVKVNGQMELPL